MTLTALVLARSLIGCTPAADPLVGLPAPAFEVSGQQAVELDREPATFTLPEATIAAADLPAAGGVPIGPFTRQKDTRVWVAELPWERSAPGRVDPTELRVFVNGVEGSFDGRLGRDDEPGAWRIAKGKLQLVSEGEPTGVTVENRSLDRLLKRLEPKLSGLESDAYVRYTHVGPISERGLLLPGGASGDWELVIPPGAKLRARAQRIEAPPLSSDGAELVVAIVVAGVETEVHRVSIDAAPRSIEADLSRWAGERVTLRLRVDPGKTTTADWVFLGAPSIEGTPTSLPRRVVVIGIDTLRPDHLGTYGYDKATSPELDALANSSIVFEDAHGPAPRTRPSFRTATTGRWPLEAVGAPSVGSVFSEHGWATAGIVANTHLNPRFDFHSGYDYWWLDPEAKANTQVDRGLDWLEQNRARDTFMFLHIMDPHLNYIAPEPFASMFVTDVDPSLPKHWTRWEAQGWGSMPARKSQMIAQYDGEIAYTSKELGRFIEGLDALPGRTLVVVHTDHGEEFWDHGGYEHNHTVYEELVRTVLWVRPPGLSAGRRVAIGANQVDIAATLYDFAGITDAPATDGQSLKPWADADGADDPPPIERLQPVAWARYDVERWGVIVDHHKYILFTGSGKEELYDLAADPKEQADLSDTADLAPFRDALANVYGIPVGPGWRIRVSLSSTEPVTIVLPAPCENAGIIDPEAMSDRPANQEWGEIPVTTVTDVGAVRISEDKTTITYTPGAKPTGTLFVRFASVVDPDGVKVLVGTEELQRRKDKVLPAYSHRGDRLDFQPGIVLEPPEDEAKRMADLAEKSGDADSGDLDMLRSLGYIHEDGGK